MREYVRFHGDVNHMQSIPSDVRQIIFSNLNRTDAIKFRRTCRQWSVDISKIWEKIFNEPFPQWSKRESIKWNLTKRGYLCKSINIMLHSLKKQPPKNESSSKITSSGNLKIGYIDSKMYFSVYQSEKFKYSIPMSLGLVENTFFCSNNENFVLYSQLLWEDFGSFSLTFWNVHTKMIGQSTFDDPIIGIEAHLDFIYCSFHSKVMIFDARTSKLLKTLNFVDRFFISEGVLYERFWIESWWKAHYFDRSAEPGWFAKANKYLVSYWKNID